jgi:hypothetical protein
MTGSWLIVKWVGITVLALYFSTDTGGYLAISGQVVEIGK